MADIFVSYASQDRDRIVPLVAEFEREGWSVWWDRNIATGEPFDRVIERELDAASCVVVVWSTHSVESSWVRNEAAEGLVRDRLTPVAIDDVRPPLAYRSIQTANLVGWKGKRDDPALAQLLVDIRTGLPAAEQPSDSVGAAPGPRTIPDEQILAILPLRDLTPEQNLGYLCDGLAEDLMNAAFQIDGVHVLSSRQTFAYREVTQSVGEIGQALGASLLLEGSVRRSPDGLVALIRLEEVSTGHTVFSERIAEHDDDIAKLEAAVTSNVLEGIQRHLGFAETRIETFSSIPDPLAFSVIKQVREPDLSDVEGFQWALKTIAALECALAIDPAIESAYVELGNLYMRLQGVFGTDVVKPKLRVLLEQLYRVRPESPAALAIEIELAEDMRALAVRCKRDILVGEGLYAYAHPTGWPDVRIGLGHAIAHSGLYQEALSYFEQVDRQGEPNRFNNLTHQIGCQIALGDFEGALYQIQRMRDRAPNGDTGALVPTWEFLAQIATGDIEEAEASLARAQHNVIFEKLHAKDILRHRREPSVTLNASEFSQGKNKETHAYSLLALGLVEEGLGSLEAAVVEAARSGGLHWISYRLPIYRHLFDASVARHPRYRAVIETLGLDEASRREIQQEIADLVPVTGVVLAPLIEI